MFEIRLDNPATPPNIVIDGAYAATNLMQQIAQNGNEIKLMGLLGEVLVAAARTYPTWSFEIQIVAPLGLTYFVHRVYIFNERRVKVGDIWRTSSLEVALTNLRIKKIAERGTSRRTSKLDSALKLIKKFCTEPSLVEMVNDEQDAMYNGLHEQQRAFSGKYGVLMNGVKAHLTEYIAANLELFFEEVPTLAQVANKEILLAARDHSEISTAIKNAPATSQLTVILRDDKYVLQRAGMSLVIMESGDLPDEVRMKIGMLKLVEQGQFIRGIGYRHSPISMLIIYDGPIL